MPASIVFTASIGYEGCRCRMPPRVSQLNPNHPNEDETARQHNQRIVPRHGVRLPSRRICNAGPMRTPRQRRHAPDAVHDSRTRKSLPHDRGQVGAGRCQPSATTPNCRTTDSEGTPLFLTKLRTRDSLHQLRRAVTIVNAVSMNTIWNRRPSRPRRSCLCASAEGSCRRSDVRRG